MCVATGDIMTDDKQQCHVDLEPIGRREIVEPGTTILAATQSSGVELVATCGGMGTCGNCRIRLEKGELTSLTLIETGKLSTAEIGAGYRLACQAEILSDVRIDIPPESLTALQRLQIEGLSVSITPDPLVLPIDLNLPQPTLTDIRSDEARLKASLAEHGFSEIDVSVPVLANGVEKLRETGWSARFGLRQKSTSATHKELIAILPVQSPLLGLAIDIGTTKLAAYLIDLSTGATLVKTGTMNPQIAYGEDVVSRIAYANNNEAGRQILQSRLVKSINSLIRELCSTAHTAPEQIVEVVAVGNTAMHHLFVGLPVRQLGEAPYVATVSDSCELRAREVGLQVSPGAMLYLPPNIAGYVGADHVAMLLASSLGQASRSILALDIGTNTEITLAYGGRLICCSCASGPAFEGAHIRDGMRAVPGAIERVRFANDHFQVHTIGDTLPVGICGSGILDAIAEAFAAGIIDRRGVPRKEHPLIAELNGTVAVRLVPASATKHGRDIIMTRADVNEIQLAKAAIRAGVEILLAESEIDSTDLDEIIVAGAFGTYLNIGSAISSGLLPELPLEQYHQVGNAAGLGAQHLLISRSARASAEKMARTIEYIELTTHASFTDTFTQSLYF
jgi:uncharacterized 2Fe-2S/4Fe-4S cluster protein (DUF4445 family)